MKKLRLVQILRAPIGGLFRHVIDITEGLHAKGFDVAVIVDSSANDEQTEAKLKDLAQYCTLGIHRTEMPRLLGYGDFKSLVFVQNLVSTLKPDIIHGHGAKGGFYARLANTKNIAAKRFYTPHGGALHFDSKKLTGAAFMAIEKFLLKRTDGLIFESEFAKTTYSAKIAKPSCPAHVIYNGLRAEEFDALPELKDASDFLYIGELRKLKGVDVLLSALSAVHKNTQEKPTLTIVGSGPDSADFKQQAQDLHLENHVKFMGAMPARNAFSLGRCIVVPSRAESLPYIVLEAAAIAKPIIATDVGGIGEIFGDQKHQLIRPDNISDLQNKLISFLNNDLSKIGNFDVLQKNVMDKFSYNMMLDTLTSYYCETMNK